MFTRKVFCTVQLGVSIRVEVFVGNKYWFLSRMILFLHADNSNSCQQFLSSYRLLTVLSLVYKMMIGLNSKSSISLVIYLSYSRTLQSSLDLALRYTICIMGRVCSIDYAIGWLPHREGVTVTGRWLPVTLPGCARADPLYACVNEPDCRRSGGVTFGMRNVRCARRWTLCFKVGRCLSS